MKILIVLLTVCITSIYSFAQNSTISNQEKNKISEIKYCAVVRDDGLMVIQLDGKEITSDVNFKNGTVLKTNCTVINNKGEKINIKEGDCLDESGNILKGKHDNDDKNIDRVDPAEKLSN